MIKSVIAGAVKGSQNVFRNSNKGILSSAVVANTKFVNTQRFYSSKAAATTSANTFAVVLSGCGFLDGTEITEAVSILVHLSEKGYQAQFFAPNTEQNEVYDHNTRDLEKNEVRNIIAESSRITRQKTLPLSQLKARNFEGLILPGGFGVAKNLSTYGNEPNDFTVVPELATAIKEFYDEKKPIAACCIAPILVAKVLGKSAGGPGCTITLGGDSQVEEHAKQLGNEIVQTKATDAFTDETTRVITTPAYMLKNPSPHEVYQGIGQMITQLISATGSKGKKGDDQEDWAFYEWYATTKLGMKKEEWELLKRDAQKREEFKKQKEANK